MEEVEAITQNAILVAHETLPKILEARSEKNYGTIYSIKGSVVTARHKAGSMYELVRVGHQEHLGEIYGLDSDTVKIHMFDETCGLKVGDPVLGTGSALSVELGPGIMDNVFDGIQRPLRDQHPRSIYTPKGYRPALDRDKMWYFEPHIYKVGDHLTGGDIFGKVSENNLFTNHSIMVPPKAMGQIKYIAQAGNYNLNDVILELELQEKTTKHTMMQVWPVRQPRPCAEVIRSDSPFFTGFRVLDTLFPLAQGGTGVCPGAFGCGKTVCLQSIYKYSNIDCLIVVWCGGRSNELAGDLLEFPELQVKIGEKYENIMGRTSIISNTCNMSLASREASIYTGITIAEYYRDQGKHVMLTADSTSHWAEALSQISGLLEEMPAESGYPSYLSSRLASFYERAGKVVCLGNPCRTGSVTIIGAVSPPGGDFSEPVSTATLNIVKVFWGFDNKLAKRNHFPAVNWFWSWSKYTDTLKNFYESVSPDYSSLLQKIKNILKKEEDLSEIVELVQFVGKDSVINEFSESDRISLDIARLIREDFLQQNGFTSYDRFCPFYKSLWMMRNIVTYYELAIQLIEQSPANQQLSWRQIKSCTSEVYHKLTTQKFQEPSAGEDQVTAWMRSLNEDIQNAFKLLHQ